MFGQESVKISSFLTTRLSNATKNPQIATKQSLNIPTWSINQELKTTKDVLRQTIHQNRKRKGQELPIIEKACVPRRRIKKPKNGDVSEEILRRREKNRKAAMKCREKKRKTIDNLQEKIRKYENKNHELEKAIRNFEQEKTKLMNLLEGHKCSKGIQGTKNHLHQEPRFQELSYNSGLEFLVNVTEDGGSLQHIIGQLDEEMVQQQSNYLLESSSLRNDKSQNISIEEILDELPNDALWEQIKIS